MYFEKMHLYCFCFSQQCKNFFDTARANKNNSECFWLFCFATWWAIVRHNLNDGLFKKKCYMLSFLWKNSRLFSVTMAAILVFFRKISGISLEETLNTSLKMRTIKPLTWNICNQDYKNLTPKVHPNSLTEFDSFRTVFDRQAKPRWKAQRKNTRTGMYKSGMR